MRSHASYEFLSTLWSSIPHSSRVGLRLRVGEAAGAATTGAAAADVVVAPRSTPLAHDRTPTPEMADCTLLSDD